MTEACDCCEVPVGDAHDEPRRLTDVSELRRAAAAGVLLIVSAVAGSAATHAVELGAQLGALAIGASTFVPDTIRRLTQRRIGVGTLMTIAAVGGVLLGEFGDAAMLALLFSISEGLERFALVRTSRGLRSLLTLVPDRVTVRRSGSEQVVSAAELALGDVMLVRPGERLATDGSIVAGRTALDMSAITGESMPVEASPGDEVFAGSINGSGAIEVRATATASDNSIARIVRIVETEQARKGPRQRLADRVARPLVPAVIALSAVIAVVGSIVGEPAVWIHRSLVVLVAASPCALAISVPVAVVSAIGAASRFGILIKGGAALEALGTIRRLGLDKTGTLTRNQPRVIEVVAAPGADHDEVLGLAASLEARSEHPLSRAILDRVERVDAADNVEAVPGCGLVGTVNGVAVRLGRPGWLSPGDLADAVARLQAGGATTVVVERAGTVVGAIAVRDELRPEVGAAVQQLIRQDYDLAMLTGDNAVTARALAKAAGIGEVHADLRPEQKAALISGFDREMPTAMVGDGINDAPALATGTIGIAIGAVGADAAVETADVALMGEDLRHLPQALGHARRARRIMLQNIAMSLMIVASLVPLAVAGRLGLASVVLIHELAEVIVIANGLRAGRLRGFESTRLVSKLSELTPGVERDTIRGGVGPTPSR